MADSRFDNVKYICWLKVCMALLFAKEGLEKLTDRWAKTFHEQFKKTLGGRVCESCSTDDLKRQWSQYNMRCNNNICDRWLNAIRNYLTTKQTIEWDNTHISHLPTIPWECLKLFMPYGCEAIKEARDADLAGILTLYINNKHFQALIGGNSPLLEKVKEIRNKIMHSGNLELEKKEMDEYIDTILELLQCHPNLSADIDCKDARENINKLKMSVPEVSKHLKEYEVRSLNARLDAMDLTVNQTHHSYNELKKLVEEQTGVETNLESDVDKIKTNYDQLYKDFHKLKSKVSQMNQLLSKFTNTDEIKDVDLKRLVNQAEKLADMERDLQTINGHISNLEQRLHSCEGRLDQHDIKASQHGQRLDQQEMVSGQHGQRLDQQEMVSGQHGQRLDQQEVVSGQHGQRLDQQEMVSGQHGQRLDQQELISGQHGQQLDQQEMKSGQHGQRLEQQEMTSGQHGQRLNQQEKKAEILFQQMRKLDEIGSEAGNKKSRETPFEERKKDLQQRLLRLYQNHCKDIAISPLRPNMTRLLSEMYVPQTLKVVDPRGKKKTMETEASSREQQQEKEISKIRDVFYSDGNLCKNIYVTAEAGFGKSIFCQYLVSLWCRAHSTGDTEPKLDNEKVMKTFPLLFYITLSGISLESQRPKVDQYASLIEGQWELDDSVKVKDFLVDEHCLIIADALDESPQDLPYRGKQNNSTLLITSRPWKVETLRTVIEGKNICRQLTISNLKDTSYKTLSDNIISALASASTGRHKERKYFIQEMTKRGLQSFLSIPVLLVQMLCLWYDGKSIGNSQAEIYFNIIHHQIELKEEKDPIPCSLFSKTNEKSPLNCPNSDCYCRKYDTIICKVARLAFETLFNKNRTMSMYFNHKQTEFYGLSKEDIQICLKTGLLTQEKLFGLFTDLEKEVRFFHKSHHELFISVHLSTFDQLSQLPTDLNSVLTNLDEALKLDKVLMFVAGMNPKMATELAAFIVEKCSGDSRIQEHRRTAISVHGGLVEQVQNLILAAEDESRKYPNMLKPKFRLDDIFVNDDNESRVLSSLPCLEISHLASITMSHNVQVEAVMSHVQNTAGLQKVDLWNCTIGSRETAVKLVPQSLCVLILSLVNLPREALTTLSHKLKTTNLRKLWLDTLTCGSHGELEDGKCGVEFDLTRQSHLERLNIWICNMSGWSLPTATPQMKHVHLFSVTIPGAMLSGFLRGLPQTGVSVYLLNVTVRPAGDIVSCLDQLRGSRVVEQDGVEGRGEGELFVDTFEFI